MFDNCLRIFITLAKKLLDNFKLSIWKANHFLWKAIQVLIRFVIGNIISVKFLLILRKQWFYKRYCYWCW